MKKRLAATAMPGKFTFVQQGPRDVDGPSHPLRLDVVAIWMATA
jgi:hypothetical protein